VTSIRLVIADELLRRFDAFASAGGSSRTAAIRKLMANTVQSPLLASINSKEPRCPERITLRISRREAMALQRQASLMGLGRAGWVSGLVRRHLSKTPTLSRPDQLTMSDIQGELRRIAAKLNQIGQSVDLAANQGAPLALDGQYFETLRVEVREHIVALRKALEGNLAYWDGVDG
jgi:hypothetical protein